jgi:serine/threonine-protein kinase PknG
VSSRLTSAPIGSARTASTRPTRRIVSTRTQVHHLGAGITSVPAAPVPDPQSVILAHPEVAEDKRVCANCGAPVGRSRDGHPGRTEGFCPKCRTAYSFAPKLQPGQLVGGQYEVAGAVAHGGLGWIYLARDKNVSDRYVVLKGLLNTGDADAYAAAVAERQFLAAVQHPLIVEIYNFVLHEGAGYIVMEYVGGRSLKEILKARQVANGGKYDPFPPDQAVAYIVEILPAFSYLHNQGLLYCDFKPDNVIQAGDALTVIDLGGVRRADDDQSAIYGTVGFQAPEVAEVGPSIASDVFTIGRTLAVLAMEFRGYQTTFVTSLPEVGDTPLFQQHDSLYRVLAKATAPSPDDRFQTVDELRDQLLGVLREMVAMGGSSGGVSHAAPSSLFGAPTAAGETLEWDELPELRVDPTDPAAAWLSTVSVADGTQRLAALDTVPREFAEQASVRLARVRAAIDAGQLGPAAKQVDQILAIDPWEWRAVWMSGLIGLIGRDGPGAMAAFNTVLGQVPGELAPKLALALACELGGEPAVAESLYRLCATVDANFTAPAAFGLARIATARHDVPAALAALDLVGPTSGAYVAGRMARARLLASSGGGLGALADAMGSIDHVAVDAHDRQLVLLTVLDEALATVLASGSQEQVLIAGIPAEEVQLRFAAEQAYRDLAAMTPDHAERIRLIDYANSVRPWTLT